MSKKHLPVNIAFFSHDANLKGGASISLLNLIDGLSNHMRCFVFLPDEGEFCYELDKRNIEYAILPNRWWVSYGVKFDNSNIYKRIRSQAAFYKKVLRRAYGNLKALPQYIKLIRKYNIDIIYTNTSVIFMGALIATLLRKPHIWHIRELKGLEFRFDFGEPMFNFFLTNSKAKIFVSIALQKQYPKFAAHPSSFVVHNGIPIPQKANIDKEQEKRHFTFSMVGKLTKTKGQEVAIEALYYLKKTTPDVRLVLAGKGNKKYTAYLKELTNKFKVNKNVVFLGEIDNPYKVYYSSDVYLMCSSNETFGRVTVEAMLSKLPVIGYESELTGTKEIVDDKETGILYRGGAKDLAVCMEYMISNPELVIKLGENAYKKAINNFSVDIYVKRVVSIIDHVIS